jgi:hypothetical protein
VINDSSGRRNDLSTILQRADHKPALDREPHSQIMLRTETAADRYTVARMSCEPAVMQWAGH